MKSNFSSLLHSFRWTMCGCVRWTSIFTFFYYNLLLSNITDTNRISDCISSIFVFSFGSFFRSQFSQYHGEFSENIFPQIYFLFNLNQLFRPSTKTITLAFDKRTYNILIEIESIIAYTLYVLLVKIVIKWKMENGRKTVKCKCSYEMHHYRNNLTMAIVLWNFTFQKGIQRFQPEKKEFTKN